MNAPVISTVRLLTAADIPAVAALFSRIFLHRDGAPPQDLEDYLRSMYVTAPWADSDIGALVHQRPDGAITGFIGVVPLPLQWGERHLRAAVCSALMVDAHETDPMAGARLMRSFLAGPQDVSICETASDVSAGMWRRLKGIGMPQHSFNYLRIIRPLGLVAEDLNRRTRLAAPLLALSKPIDAWLRKRVPQGALRWWAFNPEPAERLVDAAVDPEALIDLLPGFLSDYAIRPLWAPESLQRIFTELRNKPLRGPLTARLVKTPAGAPVGAYLYHGAPGQTAQVLQVFTTKRNAPAVLDRMFAHAAESGMVAVIGRSEPHLLDALLGRKLILFHNAASGAYSRDPEITAAFERGEAFFNGIAGETWSRLIGDDFGTAAR